MKKVKPIDMFLKAYCKKILFLSTGNSVLGVFCILHHLNKMGGGVDFCVARSSLKSYKAPHAPKNLNFISREVFKLKHKTAM